MYLQLQDKDREHIAVVEDRGNSFTYGELTDFTAEFGEQLPSRTLIFILCRNTMGTIAAHVASIENGIVPLMISSRMDPELRNRLTETYHPEYLWAPEEMAEELALPAGYRSFGYALFKTGYSSPEMNDELAMLLTTSGTTGSPKLIRHTYGNLESNAANVAAFFGFGADDRPLIDLQLHYTMGLNVACSSLYAGATLVMTTYNVVQLQYWSYIKEQEITCLTGVPYTYEMLKKLKFFRRDFPSLRILAEGGGKLSDALFRECAEYAEKYGKLFFATFGASETTARMAFLEPSKAMEKTGSIGNALPGGELFLVDEDRRVIEETEASGELAYSGPNVTMGYALCAEDLQAGDEWQGVYYTGDMARRDADGYYYIIGRRSRFLKLYGYRVGLDECERILSEHFGADFACVGNDERMRIYTTYTGDEAEVRHFISEKTKLAPGTFAVEHIDALPRNEAGKIRYAALEI